MKALSEIHVTFDLFKELIEKCNFSELQRRTFCACLANGLGYGGISAVSSNLNIDPKTVRRAIRELKGEIQLPESGQRLKGGGRKKLIDKEEGLRDAIRSRLDAHTYGNPQDLLLYTNLSLRKLSDLLKEHGFNVSHTVVGEIIEELGYSKQGNRKLMQVGAAHPDRDAQFRFINEKGKEWLANGDPLISIDCKKKENLGNFTNSGQEYRKSKDARKTLDHDFLIRELGKVAPYGIYVLNDNTGFVNLGTSSDTSEFAGESLKRWWLHIGLPTFQGHKKLYIVCDGGGSNGWRPRLWKWVLASLADELGLEIHVSHLPPGTSKWNKVEHRLFSYITKNWEGKPLVDIQTVIKLISSTTTRTGLKVKCVEDTNIYETGIKISDDDFDTIDIERISDCPEWNYIIRGYKK